MPGSGDVSQANAATTGSAFVPSSIRVPRFWRDNPALWFAQVEAQFEMHRVSLDRARFHIVMSELDTELFSEVSDIVLAPPTDAYVQLKRRLIEHFSVSEEKRIKQLLTNMDIGDKKPSALLREMRSLANGGVTDDFLRTMWMQRLPMQSQAILSTSTEQLDNLAKMADKIGDINVPVYSSGSGISAVHVFPDLEEIKKQIEALNAAIQQLRRERSRSRSGGRSQHNNRSSSTCGNCYYHRRFGQKAVKCRQPCTFISNTSQGNFQTGH